MHRSNNNEERALKFSIVKKYPQTIVFLEKQKIEDTNV